MKINSIEKKKQKIISPQSLTSHRLEIIIRNNNYKYTTNNLLNFQIK